MAPIAHRCLQGFLCYALLALVLLSSRGRSLDSPNTINFDDSSLLHISSLTTGNPSQPPPNANTWGIERGEFPQGRPLNRFSIYLLIIRALHDLALQDWEALIPLQDFNYPDDPNYGVVIRAYPGQPESINVYGFVSILYLALSALASENRWRESAWFLGRNGVRFARMIVGMNPDAEVLATEGEGGAAPAVAPPSNKRLGRKRKEEENRTAKGGMGDVANYNETFDTLALAEDEDTDAAAALEAGRYKIFLEQQPPRMPIQNFFLTIASALVTYARSPAAAPARLLVVDCDRFAGVVKVYDYPAEESRGREVSRFFETRHVVRVMRDLARYTLGKRDFREMIAVLELGEGRPVGYFEVVNLVPPPVGGNGEGAVGVGTE